ncbi:hypothetical protein QQ045_019755 [Rhodiola kirilowii]
MPDLFRSSTTAKLSRRLLLGTNLSPFAKHADEVCYELLFRCHISFIKDVAMANPPEHLDNFLKVLQTKGENIVSPGSKSGLIPLSIPLSENQSGLQE